jgi:hypothetical protein
MVLTGMHMKDYTIEERRLTDREIADFREALREAGDDLAPARGICFALKWTMYAAITAGMLYLVVHRLSLLQQIL